jgi:hypothetical protein
LCYVVPEGGITFPRWPAEEIAVSQAVYDLISRIDLVDITQPVLARVSQLLPVPLKTLDTNSSGDGDAVAGSGAGGNRDCFR